MKLDSNRWIHVCIGDSVQRSIKSVYGLFKYFLEVREAWIRFRRVYTDDMHLEKSVRRI